MKEYLRKQRNPSTVSSLSSPHIQIITTVLNHDYIHYSVKWLLLYVSTSCTKGTARIGVKVCDEQLSHFQSSWCLEPTESRKRAGTRITIASCFLTWPTRNRAISSTAWTPRTHRATSGSSFCGHLTTLQYDVPRIILTIYWTYTHCCSNWHSLWSSKPDYLALFTQLTFFIIWPHLCRISMSHNMYQMGVKCENHQIWSQVFLLQQQLVQSVYNIFIFPSVGCRWSKRCCMLPPVPRWRKSLVVDTWSASCLVQLRSVPWKSIISYTLKQLCAHVCRILAVTDVYVVAMTCFLEAFVLSFL